MNMIAEMLVPKENLWEKMKMKWAKFVCATTHHAGPTIGIGSPLIPKDQKFKRYNLNGRYWIRKCRRFKCDEKFSNPTDLVTTSVDSDFVERLGLVARIVNESSIHAISNSNTSR